MYLLSLRTGLSSSSSGLGAGSRNGIRLDRIVNSESRNGSTIVWRVRRQHLRRDQCHQCSIFSGGRGRRPSGQHLRRDQWRPWHLHRKELLPRRDANYTRRMKTLLSPDFTAGNFLCFYLIDKSGNIIDLAVDDHPQILAAIVGCNFFVGVKFLPWHCE